MVVRRWFAALFALVLILSPAAAFAQEATTTTLPTTLALRTDYPAIAVKPGDNPTFTVDVSAPPGTRVSFQPVEAPDGWTTTLRGGSYVIDELTVGAAGTASARLEVAVPSDAAEGDYPISLAATSSAGTDSLDLGVRVAAAIVGGVELTAEYPILRGGADSNFSYSLQLSNDTGDEIQFGLDASGPDGWTIDVRPSAQSQATTVTVASGSNARLSVDVNPPTQTPAGSYEVVVRVSGGGQTVEVPLTVEVVGNYAMVLDTADQRLNATVHAGDSTSVPLVLVNSGTAPLEQITLSATPPTGWDMTFQPATIDSLGPGQTMDITAVMSASSNAVAGDYRVTVRSRTNETTDQIELRVTVKTSAFWGFIGIGLIVIALAGLGGVFWKFGRR